jgi:hypothetical protein
VKALIVAKTRMPYACCVGALDLDTNRNLRLLQRNGHHQPVGTPFHIGEIWAIECSPAPNLEQPHTEDVLVGQARRVGKVDSLRGEILKRVGPWQGNPDRLFPELLCATLAGRGYISRRVGVPRFSTGFWIPHSELKVTLDVRTTYEYAGKKYAGGVEFLPYVGVAPANKCIPAGSLVRVSLSRWWCPDTQPDMELRCYLQLSGWYPD